MVRVDLQSSFDPRSPDGCKEYQLQEFDDCIKNQQQKVFKPLINCAPPWLTHKDQCDANMNVTEKNSVEFFDKTWYVANGINTMDTDIYLGKKKCPKPCTIQKSIVMFNEKEKNVFNETYLTLIFDKEVVHTTKQLGYGPSEFLVDMGSSLGLWFGLSVFGITDLVIMVAKTVNHLRIIIV